MIKLPSFYAVMITCATGGICALTGLSFFDWDEKGRVEVFPEFVSEQEPPPVPVSQIASFMSAPAIAERKFTNFPAINDSASREEKFAHFTEYFESLDEAELLSFRPEFLGWHPKKCEEQSFMIDAYLHVISRDPSAAVFDFILRMGEQASEVWGKEYVNVVAKAEKNLAKNWFKNSPEQFVHYMNQSLEVRSLEQIGSLVQHLFVENIDENSDHFRTTIEMFQDYGNSDIEQAVLIEAAQHSSEFTQLRELGEILKGSMEKSEQSEAVMPFLNLMAQRLPHEVLAWVGDLPSGAAREQALDLAVMELGKNAPQLAVDFLNQPDVVDLLLPPEGSGISSDEEIVAFQKARFDELLENYVYGLSTRSLEDALDALNAFSNDERRESLSKLLLVDSDAEE